MQSLSTPSASVGRKKDGAAPAGQVQTSGTYQANFAKKDMAVNQKYIQYLEKFGSTSAHPETPITKLEEVKQVTNYRQEEGKVASLSPEMMDDMMESTGMQRSSAKRTTPKSIYGDQTATNLE